MRRKLAPTKTYYSITEVARMTKVKAHVLRYWESEFANLRPKKNRAGNRSYQMADIRQVLQIKHLLYDEGYTIQGAKKRLASGKGVEVENVKAPIQEIKRDELLLALRRELESLRKTLGSD